MVIYAEPKHPLVLPEISRANLKIEGCDLPWAEWAQKFREAMPLELLNFEEQEASSKTVLSDIDDIKRILTAMIDYFKLTTYKPLKKGNTKAANTNPEELDSGEGGSGDEIGGTRGGGGGNGGGNGGGYGNGSGGSGKRPKKKHPYLPDKDGESAIRTSGSIENMLPIVRWTDKPDQDVIGFAARYYPEKNELICNKDFLGFRNLHERLVEDCSLVGADIMECWNLIEKHYALVLLEAIIGIKYAKDRLVWTSDNEQVALSPEALTAICMQRQAQVTSIKRELASKRF
jgi:hypothetical protein